MAFVQTATKADQAALNKLINVLLNLAESAKASLNADKAHEDASVEANAELEATLEHDNAALLEAIAAQNANLTDYNTQLEETKARLNNNRETKHNKEVELAETITERSDRTFAYQKEKEERADEKLIVERIQKIVTERLQNASSFLKSRTG